MSEKVSFDRPLPYEYVRDVDIIDGSCIVASRKHTKDGLTTQSFVLSPKGKITGISVYLESETANKLEREYELNEDGFRITAESNTTSFGDVCYDRQGNIASIHLRGFQFVGDSFWKDALSGPDGEAMLEEMEEKEAVIDGLCNMYGSPKNFPDEVWQEVSAISPTFNRYYRQLEFSLLHPKFQFTEFVLKDGKWVVMDVVAPANTLQEDVQEIVQTAEDLSDYRSLLGRNKSEVMVAEWNKPFIYDETKFEICKSGDQLVLRQGTINDRKKKIVQAPLAVDYRKLQRVIKDPVNWDNVFKMYPSHFYNE